MPAGKHLVAELSSIIGMLTKVLQSLQGKKKEGE
jgi:hypothetical protein